MFEKEIEETTSKLNQLLQEIQQLQNAVNQKQQQALRLDERISVYKEEKEKSKKQKDEPSNKK